MTESILVATDGSEGASGAERAGISLAARVNARVSGVSVVEDRDCRSPGTDDLVVQGFPEAELSLYYKSRAEAVARRFSERARGQSLEAACEIASGAADDRIVERGQSADLIVMGRDGKSSSGRGALIGRVDLST